MDQYYELDSDDSDSGLLDNSTEIDFSHMRLSWENLSYGMPSTYTDSEIQDRPISSKNYIKYLLHNQSGCVNHGETLYIMGASGAGKTTLLNCISGRVTKTNKYAFTGRVMVNNTLNVSHKNFGNFGVYVMQDDVLFTSFTCRE